MSLRGNQLFGHKGTNKRAKYKNNFLFFFSADARLALVSSVHFLCAMKWVVLMGDGTCARLLLACCKLWRVEWATGTRTKKFGRWVFFIRFFDRNVKRLS